MKGKKIIVGTLSVLAVGGLLALAKPALTYATEAPATQVVQSKGIRAAIGRMQGNMIDVISSLLGMDRTQIISDRQSGKSMVDIAKTKSVDEQKLIDNVVENRKAILEQRLKDGQITEEQAKYCEDNMEQRIKTNLNRTTTGPANGYGGRGMMGGRGGIWQQSE